LLALPGLRIYHQFMSSKKTAETVAVTVRLPRSLHKTISEEAKATGVKLYVQYATLLAKGLRAA